ncbi:Cell death activator CIDE-3, partial [Eurypyga helias]
SRDTLIPPSLPRCVSASASMTQQLLSSPAPRPRPYRVCNWDRSLRKGIMAHSLAELLRQVSGGLPICWGGLSVHRAHRPRPARPLLLHAAAPGCHGGAQGSGGQ